MNSERDRASLAALQDSGRSAKALFVAMGKPWRQANQIAGFVAGLALVVVVVAVNSVGGSFAQGIAAGLWLFPLIVILLPIFLVSRVDRAVSAFVMPGAALVRAEWQQHWPGERFPQTDAQRRTWVSAHDQDEVSEGTVALYRALFLSSLGDYDEAQSAAEAIDGATPMARFQRADALAGISFERGGTGDLSDARRLILEVEDRRDRARADFALATSEAMRLFLAGRDWRTPYATSGGHPRHPDPSDIATLCAARLKASERLIAMSWAIAVILVVVAQLA